MAKTIVVKRSDVSGKVPVPSDLELGELAVNTYDGKLYIKRNNGVESIVELSLSGGTGGTTPPVGTPGLVLLTNGVGGFEAIPAGNINSYLRSNGPSDPPTWEPLPDGGTVSMIRLDTTETGLRITGGEGDFADVITTSGTLKLGGSLSIANGGTGGTNVNEAIANLLPDQAGNPGAALTTDGNGHLSWIVPPGSAYVAGVGMEFIGNVINSRVVSTSGGPNNVQINNADGTLTSVVPTGPNQVLLSTGINTPPVWTEGFGTVTQITINRNADMGLFISGGDPVPGQPLQTTITTSGSIGLSGVLKEQNGGTGQVDGDGLTPWVRKYAYPNQVGNEGKFLMSVHTESGDSVAWGYPAGIGTVTSVNADGGETGLTFSGGPITDAGTLAMNGILTIAHGGTGASDLDGIKALVTSTAYPDQNGQGGKFLKTDGEFVSWAVPAGGGTVQSVDIDGGETGLTFSGGPVVENGTFMAGGVLAIAHGGTGTNDANGELTELIVNRAFPSQAGNAGKILTTDGTATSWTTTAAGSVQSVNVDGGETGLTFSGGPITESGTIIASGVLSIEHGGTGTNDANGELTDLIRARAYPDQVGNVGKILTTNGTSVSWTTTGVGSVTSVAIASGTSGLTWGDPITGAGTFVPSGQLSILNGGTGASSAEQAINALMPAQTGNEGKFLMASTDGVLWATPTSVGTVTSVDIDPGTSGLTFNGGPITTNGIFSVGGALAVANGGTGASTPDVGLKNLLPDQLGQVGKVLGTDGTNASWTTIAAGTVQSVNVATAMSGLSFTGGPITSTGTITLGGILGISNGGTGGTNQAEALSAILPQQAGNAGKALVTDGNQATWQTVSGGGGAGTVTSVNASGGTTGLTFSGGPVTTSGTLTLDGTLNLVNGGTGATTQAGALTNILPAQSGQNGKALVSNGTTASWQNVSASPAGATTQIQFNNAGAFGASANLTANVTTGALTSASTVQGSGLIAASTAGSNRTLTFSTGTSARWLMQANSVAESGSNAGSNLELIAVADNGTTQTQVLSVSRSTQVVNFLQLPTAGGLEVGYRVLPRVTTFDATAKGKRVAISGGVTIPASTYSAGDVFSFYNDSAAAVTITQGAGLTMRLDGTTATGSRTLAARGSCAIWFNSPTEAIINGSVT